MAKSIWTPEEKSIMEANVWQPLGTLVSMFPKKSYSAIRGKMRRIRNEQNRERINDELTGSSTEINKMRGHRNLALGVKLFSQLKGCQELSHILYGLRDKNDAQALAIAKLALVNVGVAVEKLETFIKRYEVNSEN